MFCFNTAIRTGNTGRDGGIPCFFNLIFHGLEAQGFLRRICKAELTCFNVDFNFPDPFKLLEFLFQAISTERAAQAINLHLELIVGLLGIHTCGSGKNQNEKDYLVFHSFRVAPRF